MRKYNLIKAEWQRAQTLELGRYRSPLQERSLRPANVLVRSGRNTEQVVEEGSYKHQLRSRDQLQK